MDGRMEMRPDTCCSSFRMVRHKYFVHLGRYFQKASTWTANRRSRRVSRVALKSSTSWVDRAPLAQAKSRRRLLSPPATPNRLQNEAGMMAVSGELSMFFGALPSHPNHRPIMPAFLCSKVRLDHLGSGASDLKVPPKLRQMRQPDMNSTNQSHVCFGTGENKLPPTVNQDAEVFLLNVVNMSFFDRLSLAWRMLFPSKVRKNSDAKIAKQRLKMILFSDRCDISDEAKQKIINNIIDALSEFVEIDSLDKVQLNVSTDTDLGTLYSVTIPVRRVRPEYQDSEEDYIGNISSMEYKDTGERSGNIDVKFDFFLPGDQSNRVKWISDK